MPIQTGGILSAIKLFFGNSAKLFAFVFVAFMIVSVISQAYNKYEQTKNPMDILIGVGTAIITPVMSSDKSLYDAVERFNAPDLKWTTTMMIWLNIYGAASVMYFVYKWILLKGVASVFTEGMNPSAAVHLGAIFVMFMMSTLYNTVSSGELMVGFSGLWSLFIHFTEVFEPIINFGETLLHFHNQMPDADIPIFR